MATQRDLDGMVMLVTGANTGIGRVTARVLAERGAHVFLTARNAEKAAPVLAEIEALGGQATFLPLDLGDFDSIRACAQAFIDTHLPLNVLLANAGLAGQRGLTASGFELMFGVNHLGHYLFTRLLEAPLAAGAAHAPSRVVVVSSKAHYKATGLDLDAQQTPTTTTTGLSEYQDSKLANVLFAKELGRRWHAHGVHTYSLHPGVIASDVWRKVPWPIRPIIKLFMISVEEGAQTQVHCATAPDLAKHTGRYYDSCAEKAPNPIADDEALAAALWRRSAEWVGLAE